MTLDKVGLKFQNLVKIMIFGRNYDSMAASGWACLNTS